MTTTTTALIALLALAGGPQQKQDVMTYGSPSSPIASGVVIPAGRATLWTSGTVPPVADPNAKPGERARYGDTKTQGIGVLKAIETQLKAQGLSLADVVYLRVYVVPDKEKGGKPDFAGWFEAYGQFFGTATNPRKTARSTIAVPALVNDDWLIEIEAFAVFPKP